MLTTKKNKFIALMTAVLMLMTAFTVLPALGVNHAYGATKKGVVTAGPLNVRSGPGTAYKKVGTLAKGRKITIQSTKKDKKGNKWYGFAYKQKRRYVSAKYVKVSVPSGNVTTAVNKKGTVKSGPLNVRSGPGTNYTKIGSLSTGKTITVQTKTKLKSGQIWYKFAYTSAKKGYVLSDYVTLSGGNTTTGSGLSDTQFETWMTGQGFPSSYKANLRTLHKAHPQWIFKTQQTNIAWGDIQSRQAQLGVNLVASSSPSSWKSKAAGAYNSATGQYTTFDGSWNAASAAIIAYYTDPRNFLNETSVYQFMDQNFNAKSQTTATIKSMVSRNNCFMNTSSYITNLYNAGSASKVNPNVITAMVIMEQGWSGNSGLISGKYPGYAGIYNHFNIGAFATGDMTAVQRGLWWAAGAGTGDKTYGRPWNSIVKSLSGGAGYYAGNYIQKNQYTYYTKKFNVMNGLGNVPAHQYMTNVSGADSEGQIVKYAYTANDNYPITFWIPVFTGMPSAPGSQPK